MDYKLKVSVITVVLNCEKYIRDAIESVLNQTYSNIEYIIIDGESKDKTIEIINEYRNKLSYFVSEKDTGIYNAMNKGIKASSGDIVYFLHSDDYLHDSKVIEEVVNEFCTNPSVELIYGSVKWFFYKPDYSLITSGHLNKKSLQKGAIVFQPATFVKRSFFLKTGYFNENYQISSDFDFYCNFVNSGFVYKKTNRLISCFRSGGKSTNQYLAYKEAGLIIKKHYGNYYYLSYFIKKNTQLILKRIMIWTGLFDMYRKILKKRHQRI